MDWNLFPFNLPLHLRILWYVFLLQLAIFTVYRYPPLSPCLELHVTTVPCQIIGARLTYSRDDILSIRPSPNLDPSLVENIRICGISVNLPRRRTHRGGRRKQRRVQVLSRHTADPVAVPPPDFDLCVTDRRAGPDFNHLISIPLSLRPKPTPADTLRVGLFNARAVNDPLKRAEISTFFSDNQVNVLFLTESWLSQQVDEAKCSDLAPVGYSVCSFPAHPVVVTLQSCTVTLSPGV